MAICYELRSFCSLLHLSMFPRECPFQEEEERRLLEEQQRKEQEERHQHELEMRRQHEMRMEKQQSEQERIELQKAELLRQREVGIIQLGLGE